MGGCLVIEGFVLDCLTLAREEILGSGLPILLFCWVGKLLPTSFIHDTILICKCIHSIIIL